MAKRRRTTAAELEAELRADPDFVAREQERERARFERGEELRKAEIPLAEALRGIGFQVDSAWDLYEVAPYPEAIPVLLEHLQRPYPDRVREGIARALEVPEAIEGWDTLLRLFEADPDTEALGSKWAIGCALGAAATDDEIDDVLRLAKDRRHGNNRIALFCALERSSDPRAREALIELSADPSLEHEAKKSLKRLERKRSRGTKKPKKDTEEQTGNLPEASMNFDSDLVEPFLERISALVTGFGAAEIAEVLQTIEELEVEEEKELRFSVKHGKQTTPLVVRVFMDDTDAPDLYFYANPSLTNEISELMQTFSEEHGI